MTRRSSSFALALLALAAPAAASAAGDPLDQRIAIDQRIVIDQRIAIDLADAAAEEVFESFGIMLGLKVRSEVAGQVSIRLRNVTARTALNAVCESIGCVWEIAGDRQLVVRPAAEAGRRATAKVNLETDAMSLDLEDAELSQVLAVAAQAMGVGLAMDESLAGRKVSIAIETVPMKALLDAVCRLAGCTWKLEGGALPRLVVTPKP